MRSLPNFRSHKSDGFKCQIVVWSEFFVANVAKGIFKLQSEHLMNCYFLTIRFSVIWKKIEPNYEAISIFGCNRNVKNFY